MTGLLSRKENRRYGRKTLNKIEDTQMEKWWKENGGESWRKEMESPLRAEQEHYKKQMVLICKVFGGVYKRINCEKISILEVGCGYGRVLIYLKSMFPKFEIYGCDQSEAMLNEAGKLGVPWANLSSGNVRTLVANPKFNVIYTSEMLIHIHPNDILGALKNIVAKTKKYVVHIENSLITDLFQKSSDEHNGCWRHNFVSLYRTLGLEVEVINQEGTQHSGYTIRV